MVTVGGGNKVVICPPAPPRTHLTPTRFVMANPLEVFGRTGHRSSRTVFGAAALSGVSQEVADRTLEVLLRHGVNHIDTAASYGESEVRIRPWLKREPGRFFLATKTDARTKKEARDELHRSLDR